MAGPESAGFNADAENPLFRDNAFDIVYSNDASSFAGYRPLHSEVHRVLAPGGKAVIMLYSRHSAIFWLNIKAACASDRRDFPLAGSAVGRPPHRGPAEIWETKNRSRGCIRRRRSERRFVRSAFCRRKSSSPDNVAVPKPSQIRRALLLRLAASRTEEVSWSRHTPHERDGAGISVGPVAGSRGTSSLKPADGTGRPAA